MASIPANVILVWTSTNASIPSGWSRETTLDDKFAKGWGAEAVNTTGGATTHEHTSPTHTHTVTAHTHTYTLSESAAPLSASADANGQYSNGHSHGTSTSGAASAGTSGTTAVTYSAVSNDPPYRKVIFIKASAGAQLATNIVALWGASDTAPTNWSKVTELDGRYLKGAGTGADSDLATDSGSSSNAHTYNHSHTAGSHTHVAANSVAGGNALASTASAPEKPDKNHTHSVTLDSSSVTVTDYTGTPAAQAETVEPAYRRLHAIKKAAAGLKVANIIGMWLGATGSIPAGWSLYTAMQDKHLKIGDPTTSATGGSNTHTHAAQGHVHASGSHTHTGPQVSHVYTVNRPSGSGNGGVDNTTTHNVENVTTSSPGYATTNITADSSSNEPAYRTVAFIRFDKESGGGSFIFNLI